MHGTFHLEVRVIGLSLGSMNWERSLRLLSRPTLCKAKVSRGSGRLRGEFIFESWIHSMPDERLARVYVEQMIGGQLRWFERSMCCLPITDHA